MRLIDADALKSGILKERDKIPRTVPAASYELVAEKPFQHGNSMRGGIRKALKCMEQCPTVDAVPVVRCKDCKFQGDEDDCPLLSLSAYTEPDDFCSYGKRKDGE